MSCAIRISRSRDCSFYDVRMDGFDVGIEADDSDGLYLDTVDFGSCKTGMKGRNVNNLRATSCSHGYRPTSTYRASSQPFSCELLNVYSMSYLNAHGYNPYK